MLPDDTVAFFGHIKRLRANSAGDSAVVAAGTVNSALAGVLESRYPRLIELGLIAESGQRTDSPAIAAFVGWLRQKPFLELAFWLSSAYAGLQPRDERREQALFFTPPSLSTRLIASLRSHGVRIQRAKFADPSCGGSAFLAPIALEMSSELASLKWSSGPILSHIREHVVGFELDPYLGALSRAFLNMALYPHVSRVGRIFEPRIEIGDALVTAQGEAEAYDVVISNPPYRKLSASEFAQLPATYRHIVSGQPNLYSLFIELSLRLASDRGYLGLLTPAGFFGGKSFGALRSALRSRSNTLQVDFIEPRIGAFLDVEQETALTVLRKARRSPARTAVFATADGVTFTALGKHRLPNELTEPWVLPRSAGELPVLPAFEAPKWRLSDYGYAPKTGYLVPHRMPIPRFRSAGNRLWACPIIWATQIHKDGTHRFVAGAGDHADLFADVAGHNGDGIVTTPSVAVQRTSSKDQPRRVRCAPIGEAFVAQHGGYMGENHVCLLVPMDGMRPLVPVEVLARIMNSDTVDRVFRCLSGTATVSAYELAAMPLPDPYVTAKAIASGEPVNLAVQRGYAAAAAASQPQAA